MNPELAIETSQTLIIVLSISFFFVAILYSSVGLGGGSTYTALMTITGINYILIPSISLTLNLIVTFIGMINFGRKGFIKPAIILPFVITSIPMAYLGGALALTQEIFLWLLLITLVMVVIRIYLIGTLAIRINMDRIPKILFCLALGAILGFISGAVGIGGGIYLVPLIIMFSIAGEKEAAAAGAVFIWLNSLAGLIARIQRGAMEFDIIMPMIAAVLLGGYIGSYLGSFKFKPMVVQKILGVVIIVAIFFISQKLI